MICEDLSKKETMILSHDDRKKHTCLSCGKNQYYTDKQIKESTCLCCTDCGHVLYGYKPDDKPQFIDRHQSTLMGLF